MGLIRKSLMAGTFAATMLATSGCGYSPAEQAFLDDMQERGAMIELRDPDGKLELGHATCEVLRDTKPEERSAARYLMQQRSQFGYGIVAAATTHLCPEFKA
ncbi:MAG: DUF732 domain-containing protein [Actinomycetia bacterium]|nr:DUF732 domain-containing protein [Actinomycetes bacterium]